MRKRRDKRTTQPPTSTASWIKRGLGLCKRADRALESTPRESTERTLMQHQRASLAQELERLRALARQADNDGQAAARAKTQEQAATKLRAMRAIVERIETAGAQVALPWDSGLSGSSRVG